MTNHPPKPERQPLHMIEGDCGRSWAAGYNACLTAAEAHYESRLDEHREVLRKVTEALAATRSAILCGEPMSKELAKLGADAISAARNLLEGENNE